MRDRFSGSMITVAIAAAAVTTVISVPITRTVGLGRVASPRQRQVQLQRHLASQ